MARPPRSNPGFAEVGAPAVAPPKAEEPHYHGHRDRLRARFAQGDTLPDYEFLELVLHSSM